MSNHLYEKFALDYLSKGYKTVPDKYGSKQPAVKGWNKTEVNEKQVLEWINNLNETNIAILTGKESGIIALDFDCVDEELIKIIEPIMPPSTVEKKGSKGWTRFFRYTGEATYTLKDATGNVVFEILSDGKKTTIPPSKHPSGMDFKWTGKGLLDIDVDQLPLLPPMLVSHIESKMRLSSPERSIIGKKTVNGRNDALSSLCGSLIQKQVPVDDALKQLIELDEKEHEVPLFSDETEYLHTERFTNALAFYANHLSSINGNRFKRNEAFQIPITASAINQVHLEEVLGKQSPLLVNQENSKSIGLPKPTGVLKKIQEHILKNSYIKQPAFALGAALSVISTVCGRKLEFEETAPNLYILNVAASGSGKDAPIQAAKNILISGGANGLVGAGKYVSNASLMDSLEVQPVRLDVIDEASDLFKTITGGGSDFNNGMSEILCELFTSSNSIFLGRALANGDIKGKREKPNVNMLCTLTPTGLRESVSEAAIAKGLIGRFVILQGEEDIRGQRVTKFKELDDSIKKHINFWANEFKSPETKKGLGDYSMAIYSVPSSKRAEALLSEVYNSCEDNRLLTDSTTAIRPIAARVFQMVKKFSLIHCVSRTLSDLPQVNTADVEFGRDMAMFYFNAIKDIIQNNIYKNKWQAQLRNMLHAIAVTEKEGMTATELNSLFDWIKPRERKSILDDLIESDRVIAAMKDNKITYWRKHV